jgi:predicted DCC family thiol-disulfide oxidoreductase YuxK
MTARWSELRHRRPPYSYRDDPGVPPFPDDKPLLLFDGVCVMCSGFARWVARRDTAAAIRFTAAQSKLGTALCRHYGLDPADPETNLVLIDGRALGKLEGYAALLRLIGPPWSMSSVVLVLPSPVRDWLYDRLANNRYLLFGRRDACIVPDASWRARVLE